jgi:superfamily II DNA or RNA helicase
MRIRLDGWAWAPKTEFTTEQLESLRRHLTVTLRGDDDAHAKVIQLYRELPDWFGVPREYYLPKRKAHHIIDDHTTAGNLAGWPGKLTFNPARKLKPEQAEALDLTKRYFALGPRGGLVRAAPGWGKCCTANTYVTDGETGRRTRIADLVGKAVVVPSLEDIGTVGLRAVERVWASGRKPCVRMTLASGEWFEGSVDHPVLTARGYVALQHLRVGELVATARCVPEPRHPLHVSDAEVLVCAALLMDGATTYDSVQYFNGSSTLVEQVKRAAWDVPGFDGFGREVVERGCCYVTLCGLMPWVRARGLHCGSNEKRVPPEYFGLPNAQLALFLRWVFSGGNVYTGTPRKIELTLASEGLIDDVQCLLRRFGVVARKTYAPKTIKSVDGSKETRDAWRLQIADAPMQVTFLERVGFVVGQEAACEELLSQARATRSNPYWDVVPIGVSELRQIQQADLTGVWRHSGGLNAASFMGRELFQRLCAESGYTGEYRKFADMDVVWERVLSLDPLGEQDVFDLTVPGTHNAVVNAGVVIHNTVYACSVIAEENAPTLVVVHKEFLRNQWRERLEEYLPGVKIGVVQGDTCDYEGKHVVLGMVQSLSSRRYDRAFYQHFGLIVSDEVHRIGAYEWSPVPGMFPARHRLGITATPRRKDGAENVFRYHIGQEIFAAKQESLPFKVRFLYSDFYLVRTTSYNGTAGRAVTINYLTQNETRNRLIAHDMAKALAAGRKLLVVSERLEHLKLLDTALRETLATASAPVPSIGYFVGGKSEEQLDKAAACQVIFATTQLVLEGLDIPALDTLFLTTPLADVEQAIGRIRRPCEGKKSPVVVDVRDDRVPMCRSSATSRLSYYQRMNALDN